MQEGQEDLKRDVAELREKVAEALELADRLVVATEE